jgi:ssDNA-binding Zn-finger/Zn-ribbon topoisomerase 1
MDKTKREEPRQTCPQCGAELEATIGTGTRHDVVFEICESYTCNLDRQGRTGAFDYYLKEWERGQPF